MINELPSTLQSTRFNSTAVAFKYEDKGEQSSSIETEAEIEESDNRLISVSTNIYIILYYIFYHLYE